MCYRTPCPPPPHHFFRTLERNTVPVLYRGRIRPATRAHSCVRGCSSIRERVCGHRATLGAGAQRPQYFENLCCFPSLLGSLSRAKSSLGLLCVCLPFLQKSDWVSDIPAVSHLTWSLGKPTRGLPLTQQVLLLSEARDLGLSSIRKAMELQRELGPGG